MVNPYHWTVSIFAGLTCGAMIYGLLAKALPYWLHGQAPEPGGGSGRNSLFLLLLRPLADYFESSGKYIKELTRYQSLLSAAGSFWGGMTAAEVYAARYFLPLAGLLWGFVLSAVCGGGAALGTLLGAVAAIILAMYPEDALKRQAEKRRKEFMKQLPGALDLLLISGQAGLDLRSSILYLADHFPPGPLTGELGYVRRDLMLGASLSDALTGMSQRMGIMELTSLTVAVSQSLETGSSVTQTLRAFASDLRRRHLTAIREEAQKVGVKIAFPMLLLIIPGVFIVLLGPVILRLIGNIFNHMG